MDVRGKAVLLHTGDDARFGTPQYAASAHFLTRDGAAWLAGHAPALVGIDLGTVPVRAFARLPVQAPPAHGTPRHPRPSGVSCRCCG